jgi:hypothetical protein
MILQNTKAVGQPDMIPIIRQVLNEYLELGFIGKVTSVPYYVLPLQVTSDKTALIYDMSPLNMYMEKSKFKIESWEEMFDYAMDAKYAIKFDLKKFYHELAINQIFKRYFGFMYQMEDGCEPEMFVWSTMPYGYTRAPFIAKELIKPLVTKWRNLQAKIVVFYDDGMAVSNDFQYLQHLSKQINCDLLRAGLVPGVSKCIWEPVSIVDWNGLTFDFEKKELKIMDRRIQKTILSAVELRANWPYVSYRTVARFVGKIMSMHPVL